MKNQQCPKPDCMYLHELGDLEASFTKEEMHQGKHQEYEKRLHDALIAQTAAANNSSPNGKLSDSNKQSTENGTQNGPEKNKEAWPSLSTSPVNKETGKSNKSGSNKENANGKKSKAEKSKNKKASTNSTSSNGSNSTNANSTSSIGSNNSKDSNASSTTSKDSGFNITKESNNGENKPTMSADEELNLLSEIENDASSNDLDGKADTPSLR